jgi:hypothetical protein
MAAPMTAGGRRALLPAGALAMAAAVAIGLLLLEPSVWAPLLPLHPALGLWLPELTTLVGVSATLLPLLLAWSRPRAAGPAGPARPAWPGPRPGAAAVPGGAHAQRALGAGSVLDLRL